MTFADTFLDMSLPLHTFVSNQKKERLMEFVCIEAKTFMEMNEALEAIARRVHETCGGSTRGMDDTVLIQLKFIRFVKFN